MRLAITLFASLATAAVAQDYCARPLHIRPIALGEDGTVVGSDGAFAAIETTDGTVTQLWTGEAHCISTAGDIGGWAWSGGYQVPAWRSWDGIVSVGAPAAWPRSVDAIDDAGAIYVTDRHIGGTIWHGARRWRGVDAAWGEYLNGRTSSSALVVAGVDTPARLALPGALASECWSVVQQPDGSLRTYGTSYTWSPYWGGVPVYADPSVPAWPETLPTALECGEVLAASSAGVAGVEYYAVATQWGWEFHGHAAVVWIGEQRYALEGYVRATAINDAGQVVASRSAGGYDLLTPAVRGDFDCDGRVTNFDIDPFVGCILGANVTGDCRRADCNADGRVDLFDVDAFLLVLAHQE